MGVPNSEVGYTSAMPRREDHEVRKGHVGHWIKKKTPLRRFVAIVGMIQTNALSLLKAEQTTVELTALLFMLNLFSAKGKPLLRNSFLLVYKLRTAT